ncbi:unnamed protein product, partial [marine sediment metagenome]
WMLVSWLVVAALVLASCGEAVPGEQEEEEEEEPVGQQEEEEEGIKKVSRDQTLILIWSGTEGRYVDYELWNPFAIGSNHQNGPGIFYEPLYYYSAFDDKEIPWLSPAAIVTVSSASLTLSIFRTTV